MCTFIGVSPSYPPVAHTTPCLQSRCTSINRRSALDAHLSLLSRAFAFPALLPSGRLARERCPAQFSPFSRCCSWQAKMMAEDLGPINEAIYEFCLNNGDLVSAASTKSMCSKKFLDDPMLRARERLAWLMALAALLKQSKDAVSTYTDAVGWLEEVDSTLNLAGDTTIEFARIYLDLRTQVCARLRNTYKCHIHMQMHPGVAVRVDAAYHTHSFSARRAHAA